MQLLILKSREMHPRSASLSPELDLVSLWAEQKLTSCLPVRAEDSLNSGFLSDGMSHCAYNST